MRNHRNRIHSALPKVLFGGDKDLDKSNLPRFREDQDHLSVAFFSLATEKSKARASCKATSEGSLQPEYLEENWDNRLQAEFLFDWKSLNSAEMNEQRFFEVLGKWLQLGCRFKENLSPINVSQLLVLPAAGQRLQVGASFAKIIVVMVTNAAYNVGGEPDEISYLARQMKVTDISSTQRLTDQVEQYFEVETPENWLITVNTRDLNQLYLGYDTYSEHRKEYDFPLLLRVSEMLPKKAEMESLVAIPSLVSLDRVAVSSEQLDLRAESGETAALRILPSEQFKPQTAYWEVADTEGEAWVVGEEKLNRTISFDLAICPEPCVRQASEELYVPLLEAVGAKPFLRSTDPLFRDGLIKLKVGFRYQTDGIYDGYYVESKERDIRVSLVPPREIEADSRIPLLNLLFPKDSLDNPRLAELWTREDSRGLTQEAAVRRVLTSRQGRWRGVLAGLLIFPTLLLYMLYKTFRKRAGQIQRRQMHLTSEVEEAKKQMEGLFPPGETYERSGIYIAHRRVQATTVSGDFYNFIPRGDGSLGIYFVDVEGHGLSASNQARSLYQAVTGGEWGLGDARRELEKADEMVSQGAIFQKEEIALCMNFTEIDPEQMVIRYANAGMPFPLLSRLNQAQPEFLQAAGIYVGAGYGRYPVKPEKVEVQVGEGDMLVIVSDGILEARDKQGRIFGHRGITAAVTRVRDESPDMIASEIIEAVKRHIEQEEPEDDQILVVVQIGQPILETQLVNVETLEAKDGVFRLMNAGDTGSACHNELRQSLKEWAFLNEVELQRGAQIWSATWEAIQNAVRYGSNPRDIIQIRFISSQPKGCVEIEVRQPLIWEDWDKVLGDRRKQVVQTDQILMGGTVIMLWLADEIRVSDLGRRITLRFSPKIASLRKISPEKY